MHLADGILHDPAVLVGLDLAGVAGFALAVRRTETGSARDIAWTGTLGAFALAIQALNVPVLAGASAHAIGAGLLTIALGPARAIVALGAVLLAQALLFADGGITVLGINVLNLAVIPALVVHTCRRLLEPRVGIAPAAAIGTAIGSIAGAVSLALTLVVGAAAPFAMTLTWLVGIQTLAGIAEGVLTALAVRHLEARAPELLAPIAPAKHGFELRRAALWAAVAIAVTVALLPLASSSPDALETVVERLQADR